MLDIYEDAVAPGLWVVLGIALLAVSILTLRWPGGIGAILFTVASSLSLLLTIINSVNTYSYNFTGEPLIYWDSIFFQINGITYTVISGLHVFGLFLIVVRFRGMMQRLREFEALPTQG